MKRFLMVLMILLLLAGCGQAETPVAEPEDSPQVADPSLETNPELEPGTETGPAPEPEVVPEPQPEVCPEPVTEPEKEPASEPKPEADQPEPPAPETEQESVPEESKPEAEETVDFAELVAAVYAEITEDKSFTVWVTEPDGTVTELGIEPGKNDWNVTSRGYVFNNYIWTEATEEEWNELERSETPGDRLDLSETGEWGVRNLSCYSGGDLVCLVNGGEVRYLRAVNPKEGELFEWKLYGALEIIAQDAMSAAVWDVTADGTLPPEEAAKQMAEQIAENYGNVPNWVEWKPLDVQRNRAEVYDVYHGMPEQFCYEIDLRVLLDEATLYTSMWSAGAGVQDQEEDGYWHWGAQVLVEKNEMGNWTFVDRGTGGYTVTPHIDRDCSELERLVEIFCLTEGFTHDWITPNAILELSTEGLVKLPDLLDQLTEAEARDLCAALGDCIRESDSWRWSIDTLAPLLKDYGAWLDA